MRRERKRRQRQISPRAYDECTSARLGSAVASCLEDARAERVTKVERGAHDEAKDALLDGVSWGRGAGGGVVGVCAVTVRGGAK